MSHPRAVAKILSRFTVAFLAGIVLARSAERAQAAGGNSSASFLLKNPGAKSAGMAEAYSSFGADVGGIETLSYNPAAPAFLDSKQFSLMGLRGVAEDNFGTFLFGAPTTLGSFSGQFLYYSLGDIDLIDRNGLTRTVKAEQDLSMSANYSDKFLVDFLATGLTVKYLRSTLVASESSNAWATDIGLQGRFLEDRLAIGFSYLNLGSQLTYLVTGESLPTTMRVGGSYSLPVDANGKARIALDMVQTRDENWKQLIGAEYVWNRLVAFRAGYKNGQDQGKLNFGAGFFWSRYQLDYAFTDAGKLGTVHSFSISAKFGQPKDDLSFDRGVREVKREKKWSAAAPVQKSLMILDVQPLSGNAEDAATFGKALRESFESQNKSFIMIPRNQVLEAQKNSGFESAACHDLRCVQEIGKSLGAGKAVISTLSSFGSLYVFSVKMINVRTSGIDYVESGEASSMQQLNENAKKIVAKFLLLSK